MCNFIKANGEQCKLAPNKERCGKHPITITENNVETNIVEMPPQTLVDTPVIAEVVDMPASSEAKPVEVVVEGLSDVPEMVESELVQVAADETVYGEDHSSNSKLFNSDDEYDSDDENDFVPAKPIVMIEPTPIVKVQVSTSRWMYDSSDDSNSDNESIVWSDDHQEEKISIEEFERARQAEHYAEEVAEANVATKEEEVPKTPTKVNHLQSWMDNKEYDERLFDLCINIRTEWFQDTNNLWNLAGFFNRIPNSDHALLSKTYLCILKSKTGELFNAKQSTKAFNLWADPNYKYNPKCNEALLRQIASGHNHDKHEEWKAKYDPPLPPKEKTKPTPVDNSQLGQLFEGTFQSKRIVSDLIAFLQPMGKTFVDFKNALCDGSFAAKTELVYWAEEYVSINNQLRLDYDREYLKFEHLLKSIEFQNIELLRRFVSYFLNEFYVFDIADSKQCYFRCRPTKENPMVIRPYDMGAFQKIRISVLAPNGIMSSTTMAGLLSGLPIHKFEHTNIVWNPPADETTTFSLATPFKAKYIGRVEESELPADLMHYFKDILCHGDEEKWIWLRSYLANLYWQPNERTGVMLLLYSQKKRCGKSTLKDFIQNFLIGERNVQLANSMGAVFGERGCPGAATKKLVWFEELTDCKSTFRTHMDRMKTAITDDQTTFRELYKEFVTINNRNEYIAATNHLVGVLEDRFTVFKISEERCGDREFYAQLRAQMPACADKFVSYLKDYTTSLPMKIHQTPEYESMLGNSSEAIVQYLKDIKEPDTYFGREERSDYVFSTKNAFYTHYLNWCEGNKEKPLSWGHFKEKAMHYEPSIQWKKIKVHGASNWHFTFLKDYFKVAESASDGDDDDDDE